METTQSYLMIWTALMVIVVLVTLFVVTILVDGELPLSNFTNAVLIITLSSIYAIGFHFIDNYKE